MKYANNCEIKPLLAEADDLLANLKQLAQVDIVVLKKNQPNLMKASKGTSSGEVLDAADWNLNSDEDEDSFEEEEEDGYVDDDHKFIF